MPSSTPDPPAELRVLYFFFSSRRRHTRCSRDWSSDVCSSDLTLPRDEALARINEALRQAAERLKKRGFQTHAPLAGAGETKLLVRRGRIEVKIDRKSVV